MQITAGELSQLLNGTIEGDANVKIHTVAKIEEGTTGALSFLANPKYEPFIYETGSSAVLVNADFKPSQPVKTTLIRVENAYSSFTFLLEKFGNPSHQLKGIESGSMISDKAKIGVDVYVGGLSYISEKAEVGDYTKIYPQVFIGIGSKIGKNCILYPGVKIYHDCVIGDNCIIHAGAVIGSDGFGFAPQADKSYKKIPQTGNVIIENDVEIGANTTVDRATMGSTIIRQGVKLDNLVQIAHNVEVGKHTVMAAQSGIAGSSKIGTAVVIGGQVAISGHIEIADGNQIGGQSGIIASIKENDKKWFGTPALEYKESLRSLAVHRKLPELLKRIETLEKALKDK
ncbi:MAG: UDP-3-O-(3-hydroxymyristoyl)glucosamine N-acyltransferase [Bacteroidia bacterium]